MSKIKILISCHKPVKVLHSEILTPIQVGCANTKKRFKGMLCDNEGENISSKNPMYCELTAQYWAWKNLEADYYGFFHYRRYLSFAEKKYPLDCWGNVLEDELNKRVAKKYRLDDASMEKIIEENDIVIAEEKDISTMPTKDKTVYEQYKNGRSLNIKDLDIVCRIIKKKYPEYLPDLELYLKGTKTCLCNMYIMKKELFHEYAEWLFDILKEFEEKADMSDYSVEGFRTPGHLAERLLTLFYLHIKRTRNIKVKTLQTLVILNTDLPISLEEVQQCQPAFDSNNIAIALASNDYFVPYMTTMLQSVMENSNKQNNYDVLILTQDISGVNRQYILEAFKDWANLSIRFIDPTAVIKGYEFFVKGHFSMETYYRLVLPELLPNYNKILYLDSDMVAQADVAELFNEDVSGYLLGACHDADTAGLYNGFEEGKKEYTDNVLKLKEPYQYFQAGVLLMNLAEFRNRFTTKQILEFAVSEEWELLDQDILNKLCEGKVKYVDMAWNVMVDWGGIRKNQIIALAPKWLNDMYLEARKDQKIIHYAGPEKPWNCPEMDQGVVFWKYAKNTPYFATMLSRMSAGQKGPVSVKRNSMVGGGIQCILDHGLRYTLAYMPKRILRGKR